MYTKYFDHINPSFPTNSLHTPFVTFPPSVLFPFHSSLGPVTADLIYVHGYGAIHYSKGNLPGAISNQ